MCQLEISIELEGISFGEGSLFLGQQTTICETEGLCEKVVSSRAEPPQGTTVVEVFRFLPNTSDEK